MVRRLSRPHVRFVGHGIEFLEPAGFRFPHGRFKLSLQRVELSCAVALHEQPQAGAHDFAEVGIRASVDLSLSVAAHLVGQVNVRYRGLSACSIMSDTDIARRTAQDVRSEAPFPAPEPAIFGHDFNNRFSGAAHIPDLQPDSVRLQRVGRASIAVGNPVSYRDYSDFTLTLCNLANETEMWW